MKKLISYGLAAGVIAATSLIVATPAHAAPATGTASSMTVAPGGTFTATVTNPVPVSPVSADWCYGATPPGTGLSMLVELTSATTGTLQIPADTAAGGLGSFSWDGAAGATTSVEVTIPANTPVGTYDLALTCFEVGVGEYGSGIGVAGDFRVATAVEPVAPLPDSGQAPLPDTGQDDSALIISGAVGAIALVALGVAVIVVRRRVS